MKGITTLCGSVRFKQAFEDVEKALTLNNWIVLRPGVWEHEWLHKPESNSEIVKNGLDKLHLEKILMSDSIVVINVGNYVGISTMREVMYARTQGKAIYWVNTLTGSKEISWREMLK